MVEVLLVDRANKETLVIVSVPVDEYDIDEIRKNVNAIKAKWDAEDAPDSLVDYIIDNAKKITPHCMVARPAHRPAEIEI